MMMKCTAVCLVALCLLGSLCDAQWPHPQKPSQPKFQKAEPQQPFQQTKQEFEKPLTWTYPQEPEPEPKPEVPFELRHPVPAATVAVECGESSARVEVKKDMFGIGQFINPSDLVLGTCPHVAEDNVAHVLIFESDLHGCGGKLTMADDHAIYTFTLNYNPQSLGGSPVVRTSQAAVIVECYYPRNHNVSSLPIEPLWIPFSAVKVADEFLSFTLRIMTDDWQYERPSYQYFLGDMINMEASVKEFFHAPLRVYVDNCVATLNPDASSNPRYTFIENHGCFVDARITGSASKFMARSVDHKLQFQLEAFRFQGADSGIVYITCHLKATLASHNYDQEHKACSYINGWKEAAGTHSVCDFCESGNFGPVSGIASGSSTAGHAAAPGVNEGGSYTGGYGGGSSTGGYGGGSSTGGYGGGSSTGGYGGGSSTGGYGGGSSTGGYGGGHGGNFGKPSTPGRKMRELPKQVIEWEGSVTMRVDIKDTMDA